MSTGISRRHFFFGTLLAGVGSKGYLGTSGRGEGVGLIPGSRWAEYTLPRAS